MKYNLCEDAKFPDKLKQFQSETICGLNLPDWLFKVECPFCQKNLTLMAIRGISFKTNARNFGDLCIDFLCENCSTGDLLYFRSAFKDKNEIAQIICGEKEIDPKTAILEEKMYKSGYNNTLELMLGEQNGNQKKGDSQDKTSSD